MYGIQVQYKEMSTFFLSKFKDYYPFKEQLHELNLKYLNSVSVQNSMTTHFSTCMGEIEFLKQYCIEISSNNDIFYGHLIPTLLFYTNISFIIKILKLKVLICIDH